jgi:hypothetical protein
MSKIKSKRSKTRKGEYEVFKGNMKIGDIFKSSNDQGDWVAIDIKGQSQGGKKFQLIEWFKEWFG